MLLQPLGELLGLVVALEEAGGKGQVICLYEETHLCGQAHLCVQAHLCGQAGALGRLGLCSVLRTAPMGNAEG